MIAANTVLVLGAGASSPFEFPLGSRLVDDILYFIRQPYDVGRLSLVQKVTSTSDNTLQDFHDALKYSGKKSIDSFLENRDEFMNLGKALIACVLCPLEIRDNVFTSRSGPSNWYYYLFEKMGSNLSQFESSISNLSIITFNYDRSLEYFLYHALVNSYRLKPDAVREILTKLTLIHFYGQLGELSELDPGGRRYRNELGEPGLEKCISGINIIGEGVQKDLQKRAQEEIARAKRLIFLGFGYDKTNLSRLELQGPIHSNSEILSGSAYGLTKYECINIIRESFGLNTGHYTRLDNKDGDILAYLRAHTPFDTLWSAVIAE